MPPLPLVLDPGATRATCRRVWFTLLCLPLLFGGCAPAMVPGGTPSPAEIPALEEAFARQPADPTVRIRLAAAYVEAERGVDAIGVLEPLTAGPPNSAALLLMGSALELEGAYPEARQSYERILEVESDEAVLEAARERLALVRRLQLEQEIRTSLAREAQLADRAPAPATVAVFPFLYEGSDETYRPLSRALAEMVVTDLGQVDRIQVLERLRVQVLLDEMALTEAGRTDPATAIRSGRILGAETVVQGRIGGDEALISVLAGLVRTSAGAEVESVEEADQLAEFFELQKRLVLGILERMGVEPTPDERQALLRMRTESLEALLLFGQALEAEDARNYGAAADLHQAAVDADPGFDLAGDRADENRQMERQAAVTPGTFSSTTLSDMPGSPFGTPDVDGVRLTFIPIEQLLPGPEIRDPGPELLGTEGIGVGASVLDIILRWP